jgi:flagellar motor switch protein FliG
MNNQAEFMKYSEDRGSMWKRYAWLPASILPASIPLASILLASILLASLLLPGELEARQQGGGATQQPLSNLEVTLIEQHFDAIVHDALGKHFDAGTILVAVRLQLVQQNTPAPARQPAQQTSPAATQTPGTPLAVDGLPGLPGALRRNEPGGVQPVVGMVSPSLGVENLRVSSLPRGEIRRMTIQVWADASLNDDQVRFAEQVIRAALKTEPNRGDQIVMNRISMPRVQRLAADNRSAGSPPRFSDIPVSGGGITGVDQEPVGLLAQRHSIPQRTRLVLITTLLVLAGIGLATWIILRIRKQRNAGVPGISDPQLSYPQNGQNFGRGGPAPVSAVNGSNSVANGFSRFEVGRVVPSASDNRIGSVQLVLHTSMRFPEEFGRMLEYWVTEDGVSGAERAATILRQVDVKLLFTFRNVMSESAFESVQRALGMPSTSISNRIAGEMLEVLANDIRKRLRTENGTTTLHCLHHFDFLKTLDADVLLAVSLQLHVRQTAALLYHLPPGLQTELIRQLPDDLAGEVIGELPGIRNMTLAEYQNTADTLFEVYRSVSSVKTYSETDLRQSVRIVEALGEEAQQGYLTRVQEQTSELAEALRQELIVDSNLEQVPDAWLAGAVRQMNAGDLSMAVCDGSAEFIDRVLSVRPAREREFILADIEASRNMDAAVRSRYRRSLISLLRAQRDAAFQQEYTEEMYSS